MKKYFLKQLFLAVVVVCLANFAGSAQNNQKSSIEEKNVRAQMQFLAGDALQGRGSGTVFERIAAEYVGSQFMQFGLEPAGETDESGKPTFVQTVTIRRHIFESNPVIAFGATKLEHGKDMLVLRTNSRSLGGRLQKMNFGEQPLAGAVVLLKMPTDWSGNLTQAMSAVSTSGALFVMVEETPQIRANWSASASRPITYIENATARPITFIALSKEASTAIDGLADGTNIVFDGKLAPPQVQNTWNAIGKITGTDKQQSSEVIVLSSHLDHLGVRENTPGDDKIFNGADDDASGTVAVLELARTLAAGERPKRTVYFVCFGSEEAGGFGSGYFVNNLPFPKEKFIANLQFEMIGRPDPMVNPEELWLTGYERSNLGPELAKHGAKLVQDPHPTQNFFQRSDNFTMARQGIIAHTVSSFGLHTDYHKVSDEVKTIDFQHMTRSINSMITSIKWLANSNFVPVWNEGKKP